jgi:hypothetical protein
MTSRFDRLTGADNLWVSVTGWLAREAKRVGFDAWMYDPAMKRTRERAERLRLRAAGRVVRELRALDESGIPPHVTRDRLHDNRRARDRARSTRARS